jgi:hypothetical protein
MGNGVDVKLVEFTSERGGKREIMPPRDRRRVEVRYERQNNHKNGTHLAKLELFCGKKE